MQGVARVGRLDTRNRQPSDAALNRGLWIRLRRWLRPSPLRVNLTDAERHQTARRLIALHLTGCKQRRSRRQRERTSFGDPLSSCTGQLCSLENFPRFFEHFPRFVHNELVFSSYLPETSDQIRCASRAEIDHGTKPRRSMDQSSDEVSGCEFNSTAAWRSFIGVTIAHRSPSINMTEDAILEGQRCFSRDHVGYV